jgi:hypothetical protein
MSTAIVTCSATPFERPNFELMPIGLPCIIKPENMFCLVSDEFHFIWLLQAYRPITLQRRNIDQITLN